jgi:hypothetical protein
MNEKELAKQFKQLCRHVMAHLAVMDVEMMKPASRDRGQRIADSCTALEMANDVALRFGLDLERRGTKLRKQKGEKDTAFVKRIVCAYMNAHEALRASENRLDDQLRRLGLLEPFR